MDPSITQQVTVKQRIAARVAKELKDGDVVNLGIGLQPWCQIIYQKV